MQIHIHTNLNQKNPVWAKWYTTQHAAVLMISSLIHQSLLFCIVFLSPLLLL